MRIAALSVLCSLSAGGFLAPAAADAVRSGHVVAHTRRTVGGKSTVTIAELWFAPARYRVETRQGSRRPAIEVFNGRAAYRWTEGARNGRVWHPTGLSILRDVVHPLLQGSPVPARKRVGTGKVAGLPCVIYTGSRQAASTPGAWWKGALTVQIWRSADPRFPYVLRTNGIDASGNRIESEVTELALSGTPPERLFQPSTYTQFLPPPDVRRGRQLIGAPLPIGPVALHLADPVPAGRSRAGRRIVAFAGRRFALEPRPLAVSRDVEEARLEPFGVGRRKRGEAIVLYLFPPASARVARACAKARGRYVVVLVGAQAVAAPRIVRPWAEEDNRVTIVSRSPKRLAEIAARLQVHLRPLQIRR